MRSHCSIISLALVLIPGFAHAIRAFDGWAVPVRREHEQVFRHEVGDVKSLFSKINSNQHVEFPFRGTYSDGAMPKAKTDVSKAFNALKGSRTITKVTDKGNKSDKADKGGKMQKCKKDKKSKNNSGGEEGCEEDSPQSQPQTQPTPIPTPISTPIPTNGISRFDVEPTSPPDSTADSPAAPSAWTYAPASSPAAPSTWTYAPAWSPSWPFWSPTSTDAPVVPGRFAPVAAPATAPITVAPVVSTNAPVSSGNFNGAMTRLTRAPVTDAPATDAPVNPPPIQYAFHFSDNMIYHTDAPMVTAPPVTVSPLSPVTAAPVDAPTSVDTTDSVLHPDVVEEVEPDGTLLYKLQLETHSLLVQFGGPALDISALQAIMFDKMETLLEQHFTASIGSMLDSFDLSLNFSEGIMHDSTVDESATIMDREGTTVAIGSVEVATTINLLTNNRLLLMGFDEAFVTNILRSFFDSEYLQELLNELDNQMLELSFMELETSDGSITEAIATHNVGQSKTSTGSTALIAGALAGVMILVTGAALLTRRWKSNDDFDCQMFDGEEEDQLHPLSGEKASFIGFPSAEDIEDEDSMGTDSFLDWARPDSGRPSRITSGIIRDEDGDLFPVNL